jgi:hypothetical protein
LDHRKKRRDADAADKNGRRSVVRNPEDIGAELGAASPSNIARTPARGLAI